MGHRICALLIKGSFDEKQAATYDLFGQPLGFGLTLFYIDHYYSACWQKQLGQADYLEGSLPSDLIFPNQAVLAQLIARITGSNQPEFAVIATDYFGGAGSQWARVYRGTALADPAIRQINQALRYLGVRAEQNKDEFDTLGLQQYRTQPDWLNQYVELAEALDV